MSGKVYRNYINGQWLEGQSVTTNLNPSDISDVVGLYSKANEDDCVSAITAANEAFTGWSQSALEVRKTILDMIGNELIERKEEIGAILAREEGKTLAEGIGEVGRSGQFFQYYGAEVLRLMGENTASVRPGVDVEVHREPLGVVGIITPWNFPMAVAAWKVAPVVVNRYREGEQLVWEYTDGSTTYMDRICTLPPEHKVPTPRGKHYRLF